MPLNLQVRLPTSTTIDALFPMEVVRAPSCRRLRAMTKDWAAFAARLMSHPIDRMTRHPGLDFYVCRRSGQTLAVKWPAARLAAPLKIALGHARKLLEAQGPLPRSTSKGDGAIAPHVESRCSGGLGWCRNCTVLRMIPTASGRIAPGLPPDRPRVASAARVHECNESCQGDQDYRHQPHDCSPRPSAFRWPRRPR